MVDFMVLDVTRWLPEHPGGKTIIPGQALNVDATCFFEVRASFSSGSPPFAARV
jgi:cytochrome b involved in lipid metabolism